MSATGRGTTRNEADYYPTPKWIIDNFLNAFLPKALLINNLVLDPCAGGDEKTPMAYPQSLAGRGLEIFTMDLREDSPAEIKGDFLSSHGEGKYGMVISNPPYNLAMPFIVKSLEHTVNAGYVVMLLRLNFFGSQKRQEFFNIYRPVKAYVSSKRPSFSGGGTDATEYMHCIWQKNVTPAFTELYII